jgi:hypothetical protein
MTPESVAGPEPRWYIWIYLEYSPQWSSLSKEIADLQFRSLSLRSDDDCGHHPESSNLISLAGKMQSGSQHQSNRKKCIFLVAPSR